MQLRVRLRDGFREASVRILLEGREMYRKTGVTTDLSISLADIVDLSSPAPRAELEVAIDGGARHREAVAPAETPFVDVWVNGDAMEFRASAEEMPIL